MAHPVPFPKTKYNFVKYILKNVILFQINKYKIIFFTDSNYSLSLEEKMINGEDVPSGEVKYMGSFTHMGHHMCTAFLVSQYYVAIAAQCLNDFLLHKKFANFSHYSVVYGITDRNAVLEDRAIDKLEVHVDYKANDLSTYIHNIGIITVNCA